MISKLPQKPDVSNMIHSRLTKLGFTVCKLHCDHVCIISCSEPCSKPTQTAFPSKWRYQQRQFIFRESPRVVILPFCFSHFSLISFLSHYSSVGSVSITTPDLSSSFCFLQYSLAFFHSLHHWWRDKVLVWMDDGAGRSAPAPASFPLLHSPVLFSVGEIWLGMLLPSVGTFHPAIYERCYWRIRATVRQTETESGKKWDCITYTQTKGMDDMRKRKREGMWWCVCLQSAAFAALQGVVCHVRLLNLSVALAAFVCSWKVRAILSYEQGFTVSFTSADCQGHPVDIWNLTYAHRRQSFSLVKLNHV